MARLNDPPDYHASPHMGAPLLPRNVLVFGRSKAGHLTRQTQAQHHRHVLITALKGSGGVAIDAEARFLKPGEALLILPFQSHCYIDIQPAGIEWLFVTFDHARDSRLASIAGNGSIQVDEPGRGHLLDLLRAWQEPGRGGETALHLALWLQRLGRGIGKGGRRASAPGVEIRNLVSAVNRFAIENRHRPFVLAEIAKALGISASLLRMRFRAATGNSVGRHVREIRLNFACRLLHDTGQRIGEIAENCGYDSVFAFSRAFQNAFHCSPSAYRRRMTGVFPGAGQ